MNRSWFRIHLLTGVILMFVAGGLLWLNLPQRIQDDGSTETLALRKRMEANLDIELTDASIQTCFETITSRAHCQIVLDSSVTYDSFGTTSIRIHDCHLDTAFQWFIIGSDRDLDYYIRNGVVHVYRAHPYGFPFKFFEMLDGRFTADSVPPHPHGITSYGNLGLNIICWGLLLLATTVLTEFIQRSLSRNATATK